MISLGRRARALVALVGAASLLAACSGAPRSSAPRNPVVKIGVILALSGPDRAIGVSQRMGIELALGEFDHSTGPRFDPIFMNETAGQAGVARLIKSGVKAVVGPTHSQFVTEVYSDFDVAQIPMLGTALSVPGLTAFRPFLWRVSLASDRTIPPSVAAAASATGASTAYVIYTTDNIFTVAENEVFESSISADGLGLLGDSGFLTGQVDLSSVVAAVKRADPQLICISAEAGDAVRLLRLLRAAGLDQPIVGGSGFNSSSVISGAGAAANDLYLGSSWQSQSPVAASRTFVANFERAYGVAPDQFAAEAYAGMEVLRAAVRVGGATPAGIQRGFAHFESTSVPTIFGPFSFDISRDAVYAPYVERVEDGHLVVVSHGES